MLNYAQSQNKAAFWSIRVFLHAPFRRHICCQSDNEQEEREYKPWQHNWAKKECFYRWFLIYTQYPKQQPSLSHKTRQNKTMKRVKPSLKERKEVRTFKRFRHETSCRKSEKRKFIKQNKGKKTSMIWSATLNKNLCDIFFGSYQRKPIVFFCLN